MTQDEVVNLMKGSETEKEWNENCDKVKAEFGGYPNFWREAIVLSGIAQETAEKFGSDAEIHIVAL